MGAAYRAGQFFKAVGALAAGGPSAADRETASAFLPEAQRALFFRMARNDQRHGLEVYVRLQEQGLHDHSVLAAALLHDCGKSLARVRLWHRVALVLLKAVRPSLLDALAGSGAVEPAWRYVFYVQREHARLGADLAARAGAAPAIVALIRQHETPPGPAAGDPNDELLRALQHADGLS